MIFRLTTTVIAALRLLRLAQQFAGLQLRVNPKTGATFLGFDVICLSSTPH
jgi:hypothetical protein